MARSVLLEFRRGTAAAWTGANPTLAAGEPGYETDTGKLKIGDGATAWNALGYFTAGGGSPLTTKGDLYGHSTVDARIPVGSDNQILIADSSQTLGVKWGPAPSSAGGALTLIGSQSLGADAASMGVSGIPATFMTLKIIISVRSATAALSDTLAVSFNGDTTVANYASTFYFAHGTTASAASFTTTAGIGIQVVGSTGTHDYFTPIEMNVPRYHLTGSDVDKMATFIGMDLTSGPVAQAFGGGGTWAGASAAITSVSCALASAANLKAQSYISVYGMS